VIATVRRLRRAALRRHAETTRTVFGCTCASIDVTIRGTAHIAIRHDDGCPAIVGRILAIVPKQAGCQR